MTDLSPILLAFPRQLLYIPV